LHYLWKITLHDLDLFMLYQSLLEILETLHCLVLHLECRKL
jgi:hypothetical protein